jgi:hypothetical protein
MNGWVFFRLMSDWNRQTQTGTWRLYQGKLMLDRLSVRHAAAGISAIGILALTSACTRPAQDNAIDKHAAADVTTQTERWSQPRNSAALPSLCSPAEETRARLNQNQLNMVRADVKRLDAEWATAETQPKPHSSDDWRQLQKHMENALAAMPASQDKTPDCQTAMAASADGINRAQSR